MRPRQLMMSFFLGALLTPAGVVRCTAQQSPAAAPTVEDSIALLQAQIERGTVERNRLQRMLAALNQVDSVHKPLYPTWKVLDDDLRNRVNRAFRLRHPEMTGDHDVVVVANPRQGEILDLAVGDMHMGRLETRQILSDSLHTELLQGNYQRRPFSLAVEPPRTEALGTEPKYASLTASAFAVRMQFPQGLGLEAVVGQDEVGYHFWSAGDFRIRAILNHLKLGVLLPFPYGYRTQRVLAPLAIKPTLLVGSTGFSGEYEQPFGATKAGVRLTVGELYLGNLSAKVPDSISAYSLHTTAQLYATHEARWGDDVFDFTGGIGFHQVTRGIADSAQGTVDMLEKVNSAGPLLRVDYTRIGERLYGASIQLYSSILFLSGWVEIVRNFLFVDAKFYAPVLRDPRPWEQKYFFMISPRLQITY